MRMRKLAGVIAVWAIVAGGMMFFAPEANASPDRGPDPDYVEDGRTIDYVVSRDGFTDISETHLKVYLPTSSGRIRFYGYKMCTNSIPDDARSFDQVYDSSTGNAVRYRVGNGNGIDDDVNFYGRWANDPGCHTDYREVNVRNGRLDNGLNLYVFDVDVTALAQGRFLNTFNIRAWDANGSTENVIVSQEPAGDASEFGVQTSRPRSGRTNFDFPFGPDCSMQGTSEQKSVAIYDDDNRGNNDVQPSPYFTVQVVRRERAGGSWQPVPIDDITSNAAAGRWGYSREGDRNDHIYYVYSTQSKKTIRLKFQVRADSVYRVRLKNVYYNNTLQISLPFSSVYFYRSCATTVVPSVNMSAAIYGSTISARGRLRNTSDAYPSIMSYEWLVWVDDNHNSAFDDGERVVVRENGVEEVGPGGSLRFNWSDIADILRHGGRVCARVRGSGQGSTSVSPPSSTGCTDLGKRPYVSVINGDVWAGGSFPVAGVCAPRNGQIRGSSAFTAYGVQYASKANIAVGSTGTIVRFGSNRQVSEDSGSTFLTFANSLASGAVRDPLGGFSSSGRCLSDPFTEFSNLPPASPGGNVSLNAGASEVRNFSGSINLNASGDLAPGTRHIIHASGDVKITGNLQFANGPYTRIEDIPQLVVLAEGAINVESSVSRIDGLFAARGNFNTCDGATAANMTLYGSCSQHPLAINGAVIVGGALRPLRTAGAAADAGANREYFGNAAELFNLRPDLFFGELTRNAQEGYIRTIDQTEVAPRF